MNTPASASKNNSLKYKVVIGFVLVLSALGFASYISYHSFEDLTKAVNIISSPDPTVEQIDHMLVTITQTENALQEYTISKSKKKLHDYSQHVNRIKHNAGLLKEKSMSAEKNVDSILNLIDAKLVNLEQFIEISKQRDEFDFYNKALKELEAGRRQISLSDSAHFLEDTQRKKTLVSLQGLKDLFSSKDKGKEETGLPADSVKKILRQVRNQQAARQRKLNQQELAYLENNSQVMGSIHALLSQLKQKQQADYRIRSEQAKASYEDARVRIGFILLIALFSTILIVYLILTDITRSDFYKRRLLVAKSNAEKLARVKEDFLANMSHEIRTPLTAILGFAEQLRFTKLDYRQEEYLQALDASSQHLLALVNDVLDFSKIEAGGLTLECVPFYLLEAIEEVQYALQPQAEKKGLTLQLDADEEQPGYVIGDAFRLKQILYNLISNAIKFTHEGGVIISVRMAPHAKDEVKATIEIQDSGIGIAPDKLNSVFQVFSQSDASTTRKYGGTGLGLSICKKLVEMQGGTMGIKSTVDEGSCFRVVLPYLLAEEPDETDTGEEILGDDITINYHGQALVIDDQPLNSKLLELSLKSKGIETISATSGRAGLALLQERSFNIVFCDLHMPEMDGKQVIQAMMHDASVMAQKIPIIAFTANVLPQEKKEYEALGVKDFLFKPFSHRDLDRLLASYLLIASVADDSVDSHKTAPELNHSQNYTLAGVKQFTGDDNGLLIEYLENFIGSYSTSVERLQQALHEGDVAEISFYAHKMVSHAELLQQTELTATLKKLERLSVEDTITDKTAEVVRQAVRSTQQLIGSMQEEMERLSQEVI